MTKELEVAVPDEAADLMVFAQQPDQMRSAQEKTIAWVRRCLDETQALKNAAEDTLAAARKHKWRSSGFARQVAEAQKKFEFYEKILAALEAGYVIVPTFPVDVFAIRTKRSIPTGEATSGTWGHAESSERPPLGDGRYVSNTPSLSHESWTETKDGKEITKHSFEPTEFLPVDFPLKLVHPQVLDVTAKAMARKIFDELGVLPARRTKGDPMVLGQVIYKRSYQVRRISFLVAWWLTESDLRI